MSIHFVTNLDACWAFIRRCLCFGSSCKWALWGLSRALGSVFHFDCPLGRSIRFDFFSLEAALSFRGEHSRKTEKGGVFVQLIVGVNGFFEEHGKRKESPSLSVHVVLPLPHSCSIACHRSFRFMLVRFVEGGAPKGHVDDVVGYTPMDFSILPLGYD